MKWTDWALYTEQEKAWRQLSSWENHHLVPEVALMSCAIFKPRRYQKNIVYEAGFRSARIVEVYLQATINLHSVFSAYERFVNIGKRWLTVDAKDQMLEQELTTAMIRKPVQDFFLFLLGGALFAAGIFLFTNQVMVDSGYSGMGWGRSYGGRMGRFFGGMFSFGTGQGLGLLMIPFGIGVALLLADSYRKVGWFLVWAASAAAGVGILQSLMFSFKPASLWSLMTMIMMIAGGGGLMFKSLRDYQGEEQERRRIDLDDSRQSISEVREELERLKARVDKNQN